MGQEKILVTGAGGFIGSHLVEELVRMNCDVVAFVHYNSFGRRGWLDYLPQKTINKIKVFTGDIRDPHGVKKAMQGCTKVIHLAALIGIPYSYHSPDTYVDTNIRGTLNLLQAALDLGIQGFVHTSTSEVYGTAQFVPITESHPVNPQSPYAATKAGADFLALSFFRSFGLPVTVIRPFNTYGPRQSARAIIPTIITQILDGKEKISLGSLTPTRDLNFVKDTVHGFVLAALSGKGTGEVINLGTGREISISGLAEKIADLIGRKIRIESTEERKRPTLSEVERLLADNGKASAILGWEPKVSLEIGLEDTIRWFRDKCNLSFYSPSVYSI